LFYSQGRRRIDLKPGFERRPLGSAAAAGPAGLKGRENMQIAMIGLGKMGGAMARRLMKAGHSCVVYARTAKSRDSVAKDGATAASSIEDAVKRLETPRAVWLMLPAGEATEQAIADLSKVLAPGDIVIDGGNSFYKDDIRRAKALAGKGVHYVDCGTSGGVWGVERGYCLMIGGPAAAVEHLDPIFAALAPGQGEIARTPGRADGLSTSERGYFHAGPSGAGHFVKMVHNGIEYGLMQAYGEGFDILHNKDSKDLPEDERFTLDLPEIAEVWRRGSVISSWLLDLGAAALLQDPKLADYSGFVQDSGEGRWTVEAALEEAVPANVITAALYARFRSRRDQTFSEKILSAMRFGFGGHIEGAEPIDPAPSALSPPGAVGAKHAAE
jgi:6-phosphogluconate dehydrogenase